MYTKIPDFVISTISSHFHQLWLQMQILQENSKSINNEMYQHAWVGVLLARDHCFGLACIQ